MCSIGKSFGTSKLVWEISVEKFYVRFNFLDKILLNYMLRVLNINLLITTGNASLKIKKFRIN